MKKKRSASSSRSWFSCSWPGLWKEGSGRCTFPTWVEQIGFPVHTEPIPIITARWVRRAHTHKGQKCNMTPTGGFTSKTYSRSADDWKEETLQSSDETLKKYKITHFWSRTVNKTHHQRRLLWALAPLESNTTSSWTTKDISYDKEDFISSAQWIINQF